MEDTTNHNETHLLGRRTLMTFGSVGAATAVAGVALAQPAGADSGGRTIVLDVDTDGFADFLAPAAGEDGTPGPFYVSGDILSPGTDDVIGVFHCWGFIRPDGLGVVDQEFDIDGRGKILIAGVESDAPRGVTGGTGDFADARGEGLPDIVIFDFAGDPDADPPIPATGKFRIWFHLTDARGPSIRLPDDDDDDNGDDDDGDDDDGDDDD